MGIPAEFQQQHSSLCLHIWLLLVRLRSEGKDGKHLAQVRRLWWKVAAAVVRERGQFLGHHWQCSRFPACADMPPKLDADQSSPISLHAHLPSCSFTFAAVAV